MVIEVAACPHCGEREQIRKHGATKAGSKRCYCKVCRKAWALNPRPKGLTPEKHRLIANALKEGMSHIAITRTFSCSFSTVYKVLGEKGARDASPE